MINVAPPIARPGANQTTAMLSVTGRHTTHKEPLLSEHSKIQITDQELADQFAPLKATHKPADPLDQFDFLKTEESEEAVMEPTVFTHLEASGAYASLVRGADATHAAAAGIKPSKKSAQQQQFRVNRVRPRDHLASNVYKFANGPRFKTLAKNVGEAQSALKPSFKQLEKHTFALNLALTSGRHELFPDSQPQGQVAFSELPPCSKLHQTTTVKDRSNSLEASSLQKRVLVNLSKQPGRKRPSDIV